eukprot:gnl/TRDRNA2_/TRDRNA2_41978_c0_seq1.p1 gnl/TRDRNA2_/TRDRNA2_41978_c0~~gnl/TRDRNA2_/TRDRNA2_41978_c0_seq1.p1  ORF type:complete len:581 (-),score=91.16 gnl/TRDRNA2_/TRDRNA2_41978_c0_seq1:66-1808(-)
MALPGMGLGPVPRVRPPVALGTASTPPTPGTLRRSLSPAVPVPQADRRRSATTGCALCGVQFTWFGAWSHRCRFCEARVCRDCSRTRVRPIGRVRRRRACALCAVQAFAAARASKIEEVATPTAAGRGPRPSSLGASRFSSVHNEEGESDSSSDASGEDELPSHAAVELCPAGYPLLVPELEERARAMEAHAEAIEVRVAMLEVAAEKAERAVVEEKEAEQALAARACALAEATAAARIRQREAEAIEKAARSRIAELDGEGGRGVDRSRGYTPTFCSESDFAASAAPSRTAASGRPRAVTSPGGSLEPEGCGQQASADLVPEVSRSRRFSAPASVGGTGGGGSSGSSAVVRRCPIPAGVEVLVRQHRQGQNKDADDTVMEDGIFSAVFADGEPAVGDCSDQAPNSPAARLDMPTGSSPRPTPFTLPLREGPPQPPRVLEGPVWLKRTRRWVIRYALLQTAGTDKGPGRLRYGETREEALWAEPGGVRNLDLSAYKATGCGRESGWWVIALQSRECSFGHASSPPSLYQLRFENEDLYIQWLLAIGGVLSLTSRSVSSGSTMPPSDCPPPPSPLLAVRPL